MEKWLSRRRQPAPRSPSVAVILLSLFNDPEPVFVVEAMEGEYNGHVKEGKMHGVGVCVYTDGSRYQVVGGHVPTVARTP